eukprot:CAMPEP_0181221802 /NCGR_PEP_ID=MMETSP1096-20121128/29610_1 /TAXON_ID=156174 ORGANISM="Chrysochromulina ericina, Strain CCMP281" /NCGR_SAMPLE_ID=MMETSP1096 /ASSEMBLY_ACC=CAM_ASM_000453 /LENGTH=48 /DNA_ID= /DNA_START= /DNA_END= /DNA_ORIENTATION=
MQLVVQLVAASARHPELAPRARTSAHNAIVYGLQQSSGRVIWSSDLVE